jgi:hypothetical protein
LLIAQNSNPSRRCGLASSHAGRPGLLVVIPVTLERWRDVRLALAVAKVWSGVGVVREHNELLFGSS